MDLLVHGAIVSRTYWFMDLLVLLPQHQVDAVVWHAGGKHQARVVGSVQTIEPRSYTGQEAGPSLGLPVGWEGPAARDDLRPQVHHIQKVVVQEEGEDLAQTEQRHVGRVLGLDHPGNTTNEEFPPLG